MFFLFFFFVVLKVAEEVKSSSVKPATPGAPCRASRTQPLIIQGEEAGDVNIIKQLLASLAQHALSLIQPGFLGAN